ncbi:hypothetical protein GCM10027190_42920 [Spirosoma areae]
MADMIGLSRLAYGDIERGKTDVTDSRLKQIADVLGISVMDIFSFSEKMANFFDQCTGVVALNNGTQTNNYDQRELQHQLDKAKLEIEKLQLEVEKYKAERDRAELEARYWRDKKEE